MIQELSPEARKKWHLRRFTLHVESGEKIALGAEFQSADFSRAGHLRNIKSLLQPFSSFEAEKEAQGWVPERIEAEWLRRLNDKSIDKELYNGEWLISKFEGIEKSKYEDTGLEQRRDA